MENQMTTISDILEKFYADYEVKPYISLERDLEAWLLDPKPVSKRNMELLQDGLLAPFEQYRATHLLKLTCERVHWLCADHL